MNEPASRQGVVMLVLVVLAWGLTWPANKAILYDLTPLWAAAVRSAVAALLLIGVTAALGRLRLPPRHDLPVVASIALLHMTGFAVFAAIGLSLVSTGRSVVLAYTTPLWVTPGAWLLLREPMGPRRVAGVALGLTGLAVLFNPLAFDWSDRDAVLGNGSLLLAALLWASSILHNRGHRWQATPLDLIPWETLLATVVLVAIAAVFEPWPHAVWTADLVALMLFAAAIGIVLPYWAVAMASRSLPALTTSLGLLPVPLVSITTAAVVLGEEPSMALLAAMALVLGGVAVGTTERASTPR